MVTSASVSSPERSGVDGRGIRRLGGREEWFWYLAAAVSYIVLAIWHKFLLNWFVGPLWLVAVVVIGPALWDRMVASRTRRGRSAGAGRPRQPG